LKYALIFGLLAIGCLSSALIAEDAQWYFIMMMAMAVAFAGVAIGYGFVGPQMFLKSPRSGRINIMSNLLFGPFHLLNHALIWLVRMASREHAYDEIIPGILLGRILSNREAIKVSEKGLQGILDLTSEFSENASFRQHPHYLCIPLLDTSAPSEEQIQQGVDFISRTVARGTVYVHCAMGHGRSATFVVAYLIHAGLASTVHAEALVRQVRPGVQLNHRQRERVNLWSRVSSSRKGDTHKELALYQMTEHIWQGGYPMIEDFDVLWKKGVRWLFNLDLPYYEWRELEARGFHVVSVCFKDMGKDEPDRWWRVLELLAQAERLGEGSYVHHRRWSGFTLFWVGWRPRMLATAFLRPTCTLVLAIQRS
jgi:protein-tyrosine phosphatase